MIEEAWIIKLIWLYIIREIWVALYIGVGKRGEGWIYYCKYDQQIIGGRQPQPHSLCILLCTQYYLVVVPMTLWFYSCSVVGSSYLCRPGQRQSHAVCRILSNVSCEFRKFIFWCFIFFRYLHFVQITKNSPVWFMHVYINDLNKNDQWKRSSQ